MLLATLVLLITPAPVAASPVSQTVSVLAAGPAITASALSKSALPGREEDARVATIAWRLAHAGIAHCPAPVPLVGVVLQHLSQFEAADRPGMIAALALNRGPAVIAVVPDSPAERADIRPRDVLLATDDTPLPRDDTADAPFDAARARAHADAILDRVQRDGAHQVTLLRDSVTRTVTLTALPGCPSRVHLARSTQRNAYADGTHVFLTTGLFAQLRNDAERAFVIAHEMAHNILGHATLMRSGVVKRGLGRTLGHSGAVLRGTERDADTLAARLMLAAGYDPVAGAQMLRRLDTDLGIALFAAHDGAGTRIAAIRALVDARGPR